MYLKTSHPVKKLSASNLPEKSIISAQFIKVVDQLIKDGKVADYKSLLEKYGYGKYVISHIKDGTADVAIDLLYNVVLDYKIDPSFLFAIEVKAISK